jgi:RNA polymerase sigma-32 factor
VSRQDVIDMDRRLASRDVSLNVSRAGDDGEGPEFQDILVDGTPDPETLVADNEETGYRRGLLMRALKELPERERHILTERRLKEDPMTLEELGGIYGVSRERVRQLEVRAFDKLTKAVEGLAAADQPLPA